jgi:hypothetical protein
MRNVKLAPLTDKSVLNSPMTLLTADAKPAGSTEGSGDVLLIDHTTDNSLMSFRFRNKDVKMLAAEDDFELNGHKFRAGSFIIPEANRAKLDQSIRDFGLTAWAVTSAPSVKAHEMDVPRIGYIHSWQRTQDEGWVRAALDYYGVSYTYFADQKLRDGNLRAKYDVIIFPHVGGTSQSQVNGIPKNGPDPIPYKKSDVTPNLGAVDQSDDIRGGMGMEGLAELAKFVGEGGTLITEGSTAALMADYGLASGVTTNIQNNSPLAALFCAGYLLTRKAHSPTATRARTCLFISTRTRSSQREHGALLLHLAAEVRKPTGKTSRRTPCRCPSLPTKGVELPLNPKWSSRRGTKRKTFASSRALLGVNWSPCVRA